MIAVSESQHVDIDLFRQVMRRFVTGVMLLTVTTDDETHAMTANAVASVSLNPLLMLVCIEKKGRTHALITRAQAFALNILSAAQEELGKKFAYDYDARTKPFAFAAFTTAVTGSPILEDALGWLDCRVTEMYEGGDHTIFIGEVVAGKLGDANSGPLIYYGGKFAKLK